MPSFVRSVLVDAPVDQLFQFHEREDALALLTPAFPPARLVNRSGGGGISEGVRVELRVMGQRWVALHTAYERNRLFVDEQIEGPFAQWVHRHEFEAAGPSQSRLTDHVAFQLPGGRVVNALLGWTVKLGLANLFAHRHRVTKSYCEKR